MLRNSVKLRQDLMVRLGRCAEAGGYPSAQEFIEHVLEKELARIEESDSNAEIMKKLQGLGYID